METVDYELNIILLKIVSFLIIIMLYLCLQIEGEHVEHITIDNNKCYDLFFTSAFDILSCHLYF